VELCKTESILGLFVKSDVTALTRVNADRDIAFSLVVCSLFCWPSGS